MSGFLWFFKTLRSQANIAGWENPTILASIYQEKHGDFSMATFPEGVVELHILKGEGW